MSARRLIVLAAVITCPLAQAQQVRSVTSEKVSADLRQVARDLDSYVKLYQTHLDQEMALHDRGYRAKDGRKIPGADADLTYGEAGVVQASMRKLFAGRMISLRRDGYKPPPLEDSDRIEALIVEARNSIKISNDVVRRLLVVSAKELNPRSEAEEKAKFRELTRARDAAAAAAKRAFVALPVALPNADTPEEQREKAWDAMIAKVSTRQNGTVDGTENRKPPENVAIPSLHFEEGTRITLVNEHSCRVTLTDSGIEDRQGRHLFYQEQWIRRPANFARTAGTGLEGSVVLMRWAVAVDTVTGQHTLLRRYQAREFRGDFDDLYLSQGSDYVSKVDWSARSAAPSSDELTMAVESAERSRAEVHNAILDFRRQMRDAVSRNEALLQAQNKSAIDEDLPSELRDSLFAIRGHLAQTSLVLNAETRVRSALERASANTRVLKTLVARVNRDALEREGPAQDSRELLDALNRSDTEIRMARSLERAALAALPPDISTAEAQFPALNKDVIVRIRRSGRAPGTSGTFECKQEVWRIAASMGGSREAIRTIVSIDIEAKSGYQIPVAQEVKYYPMSPGDVLERIYDENAAQ